MLKLLNLAMKVRHGRPTEEDYLSLLGVTRDHLRKVSRGERPGLSENAASKLGAMLIGYGLPGKECLCFLNDQYRQDEDITGRILNSIENHQAVTPSERPKRRSEQLEFKFINDYGSHPTYSLPLNEGNQTLSFSHEGRIFTITIRDESKPVG